MKGLSFTQLDANTYENMDQTGDLGRCANTDSRTRQKHCRLRTPKQGKSVSQGDLPTDPRSSARNFLGDSFKPSRNRQFQNSQNSAENKGKLLTYFYADRGRYQMPEKSVYVHTQAQRRASPEITNAGTWGHGPPWNFVLWGSNFCSKPENAQCI